MSDEQFHDLLHHVDDIKAMVFICACLIAGVIWVAAMISDIGRR